MTGPHEVSVFRRCRRGVWFSVAECRNCEWEKQGAYRAGIERLAKRHEEDTTWPRPQ